MTLRDLGVAIVRAAPWTDRLARAVYRRLPGALHDTPTSRLQALFGQADKVVFLQIGAFDGISGDPIGSLIRADARWRGVLVEPQPVVFERLVDNCRGYEDRLWPVQCAVSNRSGEAVMYSISPQEIERLDLDAWAGEVASFERAHVVKHFGQAAITETTVPVLTVDELARRHGLPAIDVIVMDVEGHERPIIEAIDWDALSVKACVYEHKHLGEADSQSVRALFLKHGFQLKVYGRDTVASR